ncbi:hypothetical protein Tco_0098632 [Tanacetum coccineum]
MMSRQNNSATALSLMNIKVQKKEDQFSKYGLHFLLKYQQLEKLNVPLLNSFSTASLSPKDSRAFPSSSGRDRAPQESDRSRRESYKKEPKVEEPSHKEMMAIDGIGWDWSFMTEENKASENQALVAEEHISNVKRPFERKAVAKNKIWVPTVRRKSPTVDLKVPTAKPTVAAIKGNKGKAVKASARWIWKPKKISDEGSKVMVYHC